MVANLLAKVFGTQNDRDLKRLRPLVVRIGELEPAMRPLSDDGLREKTVAFRARATAGEALDDLLPEAFALVREAGRRCSTCGTTTCSSSAAWCCTRAASAR